MSLPADSGVRAVDTPPAAAWMPAADPAVLRARARMLARIRRFFASREVLEVETPLLGQGTATDPHAAPLEVDDPRAPGRETRPWYLQTSPELAMKRLLAAGSGPIYQICKAFRGGEAGPLHNPEFTIVEWYRVGFDLRALMDEVEHLVSDLLGLEPAVRIDYADAFRRWAGVDVDCVSDRELADRAAAAGVRADDLDRDGRLDVLMTHAVQPRMDRGAVFVHDYPASQAALARVRPGQPPRAERFELFVEGIELANGYRELRCAEEHRRRFAADLARREALERPPVRADGRLLEALEAGLPDCSGVALGFDRVLMIAERRAALSEVIAFPADRA